MRKLKQTIIVAILTGGFALTPSANAKQVRGIEVAPNVVQTENKVGDLQYWDGTKWVLIPSKLTTTENSIAPTFALCAGVSDQERQAQGSQLPHTRDRVDKRSHDQQQDSRFGNRLCLRRTRGHAGRR